MVNIKKIGPFIVGVISKDGNKVSKIYTSRFLRKIATTKSNKKNSFFIQKLSILIAVLFMMGSFCFIIAPLLSIYSFLHMQIINYIYFIGSIFFTLAAYSQYIQALNADVTNKNHLDNNRQPWIWFKFKTHNLGILSSLIQLIGTLFFNLNTYSGTLNNISHQTKDIFISMPDMMGSIFFLLASILAWLEVYHDKAMQTFRSILWWIVWLNIIGSVFFQISAASAIFLKSYHMQLLATYYTMFGAIAFFIASYLLIPETKSLN